MRKRSMNGVTLVELLIVISVIVTLSVLGVGTFRSQILKGNDAKRKADLKRLQTAFEEYEKDNNCYPPPSEIACESASLSPYLTKVPCDPTTKLSYAYEVAPGSCSAWYRVYAKLENEADADIQKLGCEAGCGPGGAFNYFAQSPNAP